MNKFLTLVTFLAVSFSAAADGNYAGIQYQYRDGASGNTDANVVGLTVGQSVSKFLDAEVHARVKSNDDDTNNTRVEGALVGKLPLIGGLSVYTRGAVGEKFNGQDNTAYWSIEPGVKYAVANNISVKAGLRFRDSFNGDDVADSTRAWRVGAEYAVTKNTVLTAGVDRSLGDSEYVSYNLGYGVKF